VVVPVVEEEPIVVIDEIIEEVIEEIIFDDEEEQAFGPIGFDDDGDDEIFFFEDEEQPFGNLNFDEDEEEPTDIVYEDDDYVLIIDDESALGNLPQGGSAMATNMNVIALIIGLFGASVLAVMGIASRRKATK
jgi:hypothetical protein